MKYYYLEFGYWIILDNSCNYLTCIIDSYMCQLLYNWIEPCLRTLFLQDFYWLGYFATQVCISNILSRYLWETYCVTLRGQRSHLYKELNNHWMPSLAWQWLSIIFSWRYRPLKWFLASFTFLGHPKSLHKWEPIQLYEFLYVLNTSPYL